MKKNTLLILSLLILKINSFANGMVKYFFNPSTAAFTDRQGASIPINSNFFLLPHEIVSNKRTLSLIGIDFQKWFGLSTHHIKNLAEHQGKIGFLMGFRNKTNRENLRIVFYFEQWPGLSNLPSHFSQEVKGVMFFPFFPQEPSVNFVGLNDHLKVPCMQAKSWEKLPMYQSAAFPCYVLFRQERLVFGMSPNGPFFTLNLEGEEAVFQRRFTQSLENGKITCTIGSIGITKSYKLSTFNVNAYKD